MFFLSFFINNMNELKLNPTINNKKTDTIWYNYYHQNISVSRNEYYRTRKSKYKILHDKNNSKDIIENINQARVVYDFKSHVDYGRKLILI